MEKDYSILRKRFLNYIVKNWEMNNHDLKEISCVYVMIAYNFSFSKMAFDPDIVYVGSTTKLHSRYKCHKIPGKIQSEGKINILYFLPMKRSFYDYEMKLINRLQPKYNRQHK